MHNPYYKHRRSEIAKPIESINQQDDNMSSDEDLDNLYQNKLQLYKPHIKQVYYRQKLAEQKRDEGMILS